MDATNSSIQVDDIRHANDVAIGKGAHAEIHEAPPAPKLVTFDLAAMKAVWQVDDPKLIARMLVGRRLLEFMLEMGRYQMHTLPVMHSKSLLMAD